jgi:quinol monooxygenase YgiN
LNKIPARKAKTERKEIQMFLTIEIKAKPEKFQEIYQMLHALLPTIRREKGCRECRIYRDVEDGEIFLISVNWEARENLIHYMRSGSGSALLGAIDLLSDTSRVMTGKNSPWESIDVLKKMKAKQPIINIGGRK